jgi:hypothetical protein
MEAQAINYLGVLNWVPSLEKYTSIRPREILNSLSLVAFIIGWSDYLNALFLAPG